MITLQKTAQPLGLSIGLAEEPEASAPSVLEQDGPMAEVEEIVARLWPLLESARSVISAQSSVIERQRDEIERLRAMVDLGEVREELDEVQEMIQDLELNLERVAAPALSPGPSPQGRGESLSPDGRGERERPYSSEARKALAGDPLFIDYETTGLTKDDQVVEVCVMDGQGQVVLSTLVNPERHIPAQATAIHGIGDQDVSDAPTWAEIAPELERLIGGRTVVAHNAAFEAKYTPEEWKVRWVCSKKMADRAMGKAAYWDIARDRQRRGGSLEARLWQCGLACGPQHTAAGDCISTLRLVKYLAGDDGPVELIY